MLIQFYNSFYLWSIQAFKGTQLRQSVIVDLFRERGKKCGPFDSSKKKTLWQGWVRVRVSIVLTI